MTSTVQSVRVAIQKTVSRVAVRAYLSADQANLVKTVWTKINLNTVAHDLGGNFNTGTYKFTVPVSGMYQICAKVDFDNVQGNKTYAVGVYINGVLSPHFYAHTGTAEEEVDAHVSTEAFLKTDDYLELYALSLASVDTVDVGSGDYHTVLCVRLITKEGIRQ